MTDEQPGVQVYEGWQLPDDIEIPKDRFSHVSAWDSVVLDWHGHLLMIRQRDLRSVDVELVDSGIDQDGVHYACAKATVVVDDQSFSALGGADAASQQVRAPEHTWSVAESRALKRAIKKALPMLKEMGEAPDQAETGDIEPEDPARDIPEPAAPPEDDEPTGAEPSRKPKPTAGGDVDW